jgi:hypothetical protein
MQKKIETVEDRYRCRNIQTDIIGNIFSFFVAIEMFDKIDYGFGQLTIKVGNFVPEVNFRKIRKNNFRNQIKNNRRICTHGIDVESPNTLDSRIIREFQKSFVSLMKKERNYYDELEKYLLRVISVDLMNYVKKNNDNKLLSQSKMNFLGAAGGIFVGVLFSVLLYSLSQDSKWNDFPKIMFGTWTFSDFLSRQECS